MLGASREKNEAQCTLQTRTLPVCALTAPGKKNTTVYRGRPHRVSMRYTQEKKRNVQQLSNGANIRKRTVFTWKSPVRSHRLENHHHKMANDVELVTVTESDKDRVWEFLQEHYLKDEPMLRSCRVMEGCGLSDRCVLYA